MYIAFKIEGNGCRLSNIFSDGEFYKVPGHYNIILNKNALEYRGTNLNFDEATEQIMERCERDERNEKMNPRERSKEFKKTSSRIYIENFERVFKYMKGYDDMCKKSRDEEYIGMVNGMFKTFFADLIAKGFEYYGRYKDGNVINPYAENDPIDMDKLHNELKRIQGNDDSLEIERFSTSNPAPKRNVQKDYFNKVIKEYVGKADVKKDKLDKCIAIIRTHLGDKGENTTSEVREFANRSKDIPNELVHTLVRIFNGKDETNLLNYEEEQKLKNL